jgi:SAM-dependent methyltransferase
MARDGKVDFDDIAREYTVIQEDHLRFFGEESGYFAEIKASMARDLVFPAPRRILEFGCGTGMNLGSLAASFPGAELSGCDISEESLRVAAKRHPGADLFVSGKEGDTDRKPFDLVFVANVFHHIDPVKRGAVMAGLRRIMAAGGSLVVFEHNPYNPVTRRLVSTCPFDRDAVLLAPRELRSLVVGAGLRVRSLRYLLFFPAFLRRLRFLEKSMGFLPLGGQYCTHATSG